jgi:DNA-binding winged helix-turn-helix (wHTH) protein/tetratricopeptide (TPR) repeat protein
VDDLVIDGWQLDSTANQITKGKISRHLEPKAMAVLAELAAQPGTVVSRAELLDRVWGGAFVGDDAVSAAVIKVRRAFDDKARAPRVIETVHKSGYRLIASVTSGSRSPADDRGDHAASTRPSVKLATLLRCTYRVNAGNPSSMGPEAWQRSTSAISEVIDEVIHLHGGFPIHESGATIGVFGAPNAQEHHAMRAVQAAIDIRKAMARDSGHADDRLDSVWRIGIASGEILSGAAPSNRGLTVHGAPLESVISLAIAAKPSEVLLTDETRNLAQGLVGVDRCDRPLAGIDIGPLFSLGAEAGWSTPWEARVERGLTPLFGRTFEINRIADLLDKVTRGDGQLVALNGEPGAGKSRLVHEALLLAAHRGFETIIAASSPLEARTPFFPVRSAVIDRLRLHPDLQVDEPALQAALRPERADEEWTTLDPELRRSRSISTLRDILLEGHEQPLLIVFEDLHWADESTRNLVNSITTQIAGRTCVVVVTYRPGFVDPWATKSYYTQLRIDALGSEDSLKMMDHLVGDNASVQRWKSSVAGRSGGTPLFIEEVVRSALAAGTLVGSDGKLSIADEAAPGLVPSSVHALVADRIDRLSEGAREVLSVAAVFGRDVPASLLHPLIGDSLVSRSDDLDELQAAELIFSSRYQREPGYVFKHALTQEVAYSEIPDSVRCERHRRIAELLETLSSEGDHFSPELLARHHAGAGQHAQAIDAWIRATDSALSAAAFADALDYLDQTRSCLAHLGDSDRPDNELAVELRTVSALVQSVGPADPTVEAACKRARGLAEAHGTTRQQFEATWGLWFVHLMRGEINTAQQLGNELFDLSKRLDDLPLKLEAHHVQWSGLSLAGNPAAVREHTQICIEQYQPSEHHWLTFSYGGHDPGVCARNLDAMALWMLGAPELARTRSSSAIELAKELGHPYTRLESFNSALNIALLDDDATELLALADILQALVDDDTLPEFASAYANGFRANALLINGDASTGLQLMIEAAPVWQEFWGAWCFPLDSAFATTLAGAGRFDEAVSHIRKQLSMSEVSGAHWWDPEFHRVLGELSLASDPANLDAARTSFEHAIAIARQQPAPFLELRAAMSLARLDRKSNDTNAATVALQTAVDQFPADVDTTDLRLARNILAA